VNPVEPSPPRASLQGCRLAFSPVLLAVALASSSANAGADRVALLPLAAEGVALDEVPELQRLDAALRRALAGLGDVRLQTKTDTLAHVAGAREIGLTCPPTDAACLGKLSVLAEVDIVVAPSVSLGTDAFEVSFHLVERGGSLKQSDATLPRAAERLDAAASAAVRLLWVQTASAPAAAEPVVAEPVVTEPVVAAPEPPPPTGAPVDVAPAAPASPIAATTTQPTPSTADAPEAEGEDSGLLWALVGTGVGVVALAAVVGGVVGAVALFALAPPAAEGPAVVVLE